MPMTPDEILEQAADAMKGIAEVRHSDKVVRYQTAKEIADAIRLNEEVTGGVQRRVVAKPRRPGL